jgi:HlyD family secretion protein
MGDTPFSEKASAAGGSMRLYVLCRRAAVLLLACAAAACSTGGATRQPVPSPDGSVRVTRGTFEKRFLASGELKAGDSSLVLTPLTHTWRLNIAMLAEHGSAVQEGDVIARFDTSDLERKIQEQRLQLQGLENEREVGRKTAERELLELEGSLDIKKLELRKAELWLRVDPALLEPKTLEEKRHEKGLKLLEIEQIENQIREKKEEARLASETFEIRKQDMNDTLKRAQLDREKMTIKAPRSGFVLCRTNWYEQRPYQVGDQIWAGADLLEIPDMESMEALLEVSEVDAFSIHPGQEAEVVLDNHPERRLKGVVKEVTGVLHQSRTTGSGLQVFEVTVSLDRFDPAVMKPGMSVRASILLERRENVLLAPRSAVRPGPAAPAVRIVRKDGTPEVREMEILDRNEEWAAVKSGVSEGEAILAAWRENDKGVEP